MNKSFIFSVAGTPRPQPRPRFVSGRAVSTANPKAKLWRAAVDRAVRAAIADSQRKTPLFAGPVRVTCQFRCVTRTLADADNLAKLVMDVMEAAGVFKNDRQVVELHASKRLADAGGLSVLVEDVIEDAAPLSAAVSAAAPAWLSASADRV